MRFNFLLPILACAFGLGHVAQAQRVASPQTQEMQMQKAIAQSSTVRVMNWRRILPWEGCCVWGPAKNRWNQRKMRKRARRAAGAGLGRAAYA